MAADLIESFAQRAGKVFCMRRTARSWNWRWLLPPASCVARRSSTRCCLTGAVRVALGQLGETTEVRLRVPGGEWTCGGDIALLPNLRVKPR